MQILCTTRQRHLGVQGQPRPTTPTPSPNPEAGPLEASSLGAPSTNSDWSLSWKITFSFIGSIGKEKGRHLGSQSLIAVARGPVATADKWLQSNRYGTAG